MRYDISKVLDLTGEQPDPPGRPEKYSMRGGKVVKRDMRTVTGVVVHQTAVVFGVSPDQVQAARGDRVLAKHRRALNVAAHVTAFTTGKAVYANPLPWYVYHGNGFNSYTLGLEIEGLYCGIRGNLKTLGGDVTKMTALTAATIEASRTGLQFLVERARELGAPIQWIYAHRQSSSTRRSDPGEEIWEAVVLDFAVPELGLKVNNDLVLPSTKRGNPPGRGIPKEWDPSATARY